MCQMLNYFLVYEGKKSVVKQTASAATNFSSAVLSSFQARHHIKTIVSAFFIYSIIF